MATTRTLWGAASVNWDLRSSGAPELLAVTMSVDHGGVGDGGSGARLVTAADGRRWVMKSHLFGGQTHQYLCLNEAVCAQLAVRIGVNVPQPAVVELDEEQLDALRPGTLSTDRFFFASEFVENAENLSTTAAASADRGQLAGIAVLDAVAKNTDRKPEHILTRRDYDGEWSTWAIDHGNALIATGNSVSAFDSIQPASPPVLPMIAQEVRWSDVESPIARAADIPRKELRAMVDGLPPGWVVEPEASAVMADVLLERIQRLPELLRTHISD